jgi:hypothetical protein
MTDSPTLDAPKQRRGRPKGVPNRITREIRSAAQKKGPQAFRHIWDLALNAKDEKLRAQLLTLVLAYGYGKPQENKEPPPDASPT